MSAADPRRRPRGLSVTGRQALRTAAITLALLVGLAVVLGLFGDRGARGDIADAVDTDIARLTEVVRAGGYAEGARRIHERLSLEPVDRPRAGYLLTDGAGRRWAGNIADQPIARRPEMQLLFFASGEKGYGRTNRGFARVVGLPGGGRLVVMRSTQRTEALVKRLFFTFAGGGAVVAMLAGVGAWLSARRLQRRLDAFDAAFAKLEQGDLDVRVPEDGGVDEISVLTRDVNRMLAQFERLLASQRKITDQTAHDIRTPLMHLDTTLVKALAACDPADADLLEQARGEIRAVVGMLDSLLDIAGLEAMQGDTRGLSAIDVSRLAREMAELYAASFDEAGLAFETRIAPGVTMTGDAAQTTRLLANLLDNAAKYVPSPGRVRLLVDAGPRIVVEDDGPGVPEARREWVFGRYNREGGEGCPGHGLGLALVRAIAERQGLTARVEDARPGARFVVESGAAG